MDVSIDGYDVGGWVVDGGQEFTIERPAYEAKKFTFYRVKTAPEEAGIEPGRAGGGKWPNDSFSWAADTPTW